MKKIRIIEPGWERFTGNFGGVEFVNGESVDLVSPWNASRLAANIRIQDLDGKNPSVAQAILDNRAIEARLDMPVQIPSDYVHSEQAKPARITEGYTREQLAQIADKGGIKALREIAEPMGIRGTKLVDLIDKIIQAQGGEPEPAEPEQGPSDAGAQDDPVQESAGGAAQGQE